MPAAESTDAREWLRAQVAKYKAVYPAYRRYAVLLTFKERTGALNRFEVDRTGEKDQDSQR